jgi:5-methylcytosine-specific restriction endonuclease McrA
MIGYAPSDKSLWENIRILLKIGFRPQQLARQYEFRGVTTQKVRWRNHKYWHINCRAHSRRGPRCPDCRKRKPTFRQNLCYGCYQVARPGRPTGEDHYAWKGGKTRDPRFVRLSSEYRTFRKKMLARDEYQCQVCGDLPDKVQLDHIIPQVARPDLIFEPKNVRAICERCHRRTATFSNDAKYFRWLFKTRRLESDEKMIKFGNLLKRDVISKVEYKAIEYFLTGGGSESSSA